MAASSHVAKQLHLPFQSGNDRVLKEMNRRYTRQQYLDLVNYAKSVMPGLVLTSDVIIGFPGETEAEAMDTVSLVEEVGFDALFTFIYSPRPGTKAAEMPDPFTQGGEAEVVRQAPGGPEHTCPPSSTPPMWARPSGCWWTARATTRTTPSPPGRRATAWCG